jgi:hypothetical protein
MSGLIGYDYIERDQVIRTRCRTGRDDAGVIHMTILCSSRGKIAKAQ